MNKPKLTMIELFSGIGAQKRGIDNTELYDLDVVATSDIDKEAVVEYAAIHHGLTNEMVENYDNYPSREEMIEVLKSRNIGMDFDKGKMYDWDKLLKKKNKEIEKYWLATMLQNNLGDISRIEQLPTADCWFYSSPCQCFSIAGKQDGIDATCNACGQKYNPMLLDVEHRYICPHCGSDDVKGTRSGLLLEVERLLIKAIETNTAPKYLCLENVKNLVGKQFKPDFDAWLKRLEYLGYNTYWEVLNAKECGVPQNRERVFAFSIRKDIDTGKFTFPIPFDTGIRLKDILEKNVDEKYYINTERASNLIQQLVDKGQLKGQRECCDSIINDPNIRDISNCITARYDASIQNKKSIGLAVAEPNALDSSQRLGGLWDGETKHQAGSVWDSNGMSPTLDTAQGGGRMPHIVEGTEPKERFFKQAIETFNNNDCEEGDTIDAFNRRVNKSGYCPTLTTRPEGFKTAILPVVKDDGEEKPIKRKARTFDFDECKPICVGNTTPSGKSQCNAVYSTEGVSQTLCAGTHGYATGSILEETNNINVVGNYMPSNHDASRVVSTDGVAPCVKENHGTVTGILEEQSELDKIKEDTEIIGIKQATKKGYIEYELPGCADFSFPNSTKRRGRVQGGGQIVPTLTAAEGGIRYIENIYRIRKLTVRECFKLMGFEFEDWDKCSAIGISNSAGYKAAGNSICCCCISLLFEHLYKAQYDESYICTDEKYQPNFQKPETE
jgi:DNA (cytosine-5)-methyltransferase 1